MNNFCQHINVAYPSGNKPIFEEWFAENYKGCNTERKLLPIFPTSFHVNNGYGAKANELQKYCDQLPADKKYFIICQYDDGCLVDWKGKDVLEFNMSKTNGVMLPLLCQPQPYKFISDKKWFANFVGSKTHPIRETALQLKDKEGYFISFEPHNIETYCRIMHESMFTLCYRGYGLNSFRIAESVQQGSIPVYISDEFIIPKWMDFESFGVLIKSEDAHRIDEILQAIPIKTIIEKQERLSEAYENFYSYEANLKHIVNYLESEGNATA